MNENIWDRLDYQKNAVIEASAGTGKTYTLEHIVKKLVLEKGYDIRSILLVTFTEKAAGELKERIRKMLQGTESAAHLDETTICTIHAFCSEVLAEYPFESGLSMGMEVGGSDDALYRKAVHTVMASAEFKAAYAEKFATGMEYWDAEKDAECLAGAAVGILRQEVGAENIEKWENDFAEKKAQVSDGELESAIRTLPGWNEGGPGAYAMAHTNGGVTFRNNSKWVKAHQVFFSELDKHLRVILNGNGAPSAIVESLDFVASGKVDFKLHKWDGVIVNATFCERDGFSGYSKVKELATVKSHVLKGEIIHEIVRRAYPEFFRLKSRTSSVTFDDLIKETARLVTAATGPNANDGQRRFADRLRDRYRLALVDEFQDTDAKQWTIFRNLFASVGHLIVVGDPKQAIYGWRGADLATYLKAKKEIIDNGGAMESLDTMYRSTSEMVDDFNTMFQSGWFSGMSEDGLSIDYAKVEFPKKNVPKKVAGFSYPSGEHAVEWLEAANGLGQFALNASDEMIRLHKTWDDRMSWDKMCVLVRSRADGQTMQRQMVAKGIPCRVYKEPGMFASIEAESIVALFDYLSMPRSLGNLSALLLTPLFGYTPENISDRLTGGDVKFDRLCDRWRGYAEEHDWIGLFESVMRNTGAKSSSAGYRQVFDYLLEHNSRAGSLSELSDVLRNMKKGDLCAGENGNVRNKASDGAAVQIMTMHASKGLEFNAVFVAGGFSGCATDGESRRMFYVALTRACFKLYLPWGMGGIDAAAKKSSALKHYLKDAILAICRNDVQSRFRDPGDQGVVEIAEKVVLENAEPPPSRGMKGWRFKWDSFSSMNHHTARKEEVIVDGAKTVADEAQDETEKPESLVPKGATSGTVFHEVMEILCNNDSEKGDVDFSVGREDFAAIVAESDEKKSPLLAIVRRRMNANGLINRVGKTEGESTAVSIARMAWNALRTELCVGGDTFKLCEVLHKDRKAEVNFVLDEGEVVGDGSSREGALNGSIDLIVRLSDDRYCIIDWKTNTLESYDTESVKTAMDEAGYHLQYKLYSHAAEKWLGGSVVKGAAYLFVRGGEFEPGSPSGVFGYDRWAEERASFAQKIADRLAECDAAEAESEKEDL